MSVTDLGFSYEWLLCDVELQRAARVRADQRAALRSGPADHAGRERAGAPALGSSSRLPGERAADLNREETAWRLLAPLDVTPDTARCCAA
ncbi:hypothetical protein LT493_08415 [Streptomyces tricolor]|nr:hypothetical protein [Streptomyces tricolor]